MKYAILQLSDVETDYSSQQAVEVLTDDILQ